MICYVVLEPDMSFLKDYEKIRSGLIDDCINKGFFPIIVDDINKIPLKYIQI